MDLHETDLRELIRRCAEQIRRHGKVYIPSSEDVLLVASFGDGYTAAKDVRSRENKLVVKHTTAWVSNFVVSGPYDYIDKTPIDKFVVGDNERARSVLECLRKFQVLDDLSEV